MYPNKKADCKRRALREKGKKAAVQSSTTSSHVNIGQQSTPYQSQFQSYHHVPPPQVYHNNMDCNTSQNYHTHSHHQQPHRSQPSQSSSTPSTIATASQSRRGTTSLRVPTNSVTPELLETISRITAPSSKAPSMPPPPHAQQQS